MNITWHFGSGLGLGFKPSSHIRLSLFFASQKSCFFACDKPSVEKKKLTIIFLASNFCEIFWSTKSAVGGFESKQQLRFFFLSITGTFVHNLNNFSSNLKISTAAQTCLSRMTMEWHWGIKVQFSSLNFPLELFTQQKLNFDPTENCPSEPSITSLKKQATHGFKMDEERVVETFKKIKSKTARCVSFRRVRLTYKKLRWMRSLVKEKREAWWDTSKWQKRQQVVAHRADVCVQKT